MLVPSSVIGDGLGSRSTDASGVTGRSSPYVECTSYSPLTSYRSSGAGHVTTTRRPSRCSPAGGPAPSGAHGREDGRHVGVPAIASRVCWWAASGQLCPVRLQGIRRVPPARLDGLGRSGVCFLPGWAADEEGAVVAPGSASGVTQRAQGASSSASAANRPLPGRHRESAGGRGRSSRAGRATAAHPELGSGEQRPTLLERLPHRRVGGPFGRVHPDSRAHRSRSDLARRQGRADRRYRRCLREHGHPPANAIAVTRRCRKTCTPAGSASRRVAQQGHGGGGPGRRPYGRTSSDCRRPRATHCGWPPPVGSPLVLRAALIPHDTREAGVRQVPRGEHAPPREGADSPAALEYSRGKGADSR